MATQDSMVAPNGEANDGAVVSGEDAGMTIADLLRIVGKHIVAACITFVVVFAAVAAYTFLSPKQYTATTQLFAAYTTSDDNDSNAASQLQTGSTYIASQIKSYPTLAKTDTVLAPALEELDDTGDLSLAALGSMVTVTNPDDTYVIELSAQSRDPQQAADVANAVSKSLSKVVSSSLYGSGQSPVKLTVVQQADVPAAPSSPKTKLNLAVGFVAGLVLAVVMALLKDIMSRRIRDVADLQAVAGEANIMGMVPQDEQVDGSKPIVITAPGGPLAEEFRRIRTNLSFTTSTTENNSRLFVVSSVAPGEGKTMMSVNIAAALAENGARVLLIDADLRRPAVAERLGIQGNAGLAHVLSKQMDVKDAVQRYWKPNLHVLPAGPSLQNASVLLNSGIMKALVAQALTQYDYVVVDTSPLTVANDAAVFGKISGGVLLVTARNMAFKRSLREVLDQLRVLNVPVLGFVFNKTEIKKGRGRGEYYYYSYGEDKDGDESHGAAHKADKRGKK